MTRTTRTEYWAGHGWSGTIEVLVGLDGDDTDAWRAAMGALAAGVYLVLAHGVAYLAHETGGYYYVSDEAVLDLGRRYLAGEPDAYSEWCSDYPSAEHATLRAAIAAS